MATTEYVNINSTELSSSTEVKRRTWWEPAYTMYIANTLFFIPFAINFIVVDALILSKLCVIKYQNITLCNNSTFTESHPTLEQETADWGSYLTLAQIPLAVIVNLMLSSYCDRVGHKLPYLLPCIGSFLYSFSLAVLATPQLLDWPIEIMFIPSFLSSFLGNFSMVLMTSFSYVAQVTPKEKTSVAMATCEGTVLMGVLVGSLVNGPVIEKTSLMIMTYINAGITIIAPIIIIFGLVEPPRAEPLIKYKWRDIINAQRTLDSLRCVFKKREKHGRLILHLAVAAFATSFICVSGYTANAYLYFITERGMSLTEYSVFSTILQAMKMIAGPAILWLINRYTNPHRTDILMGSAALLTLGYTIMSIHVIPESLWIGGILTGTVTIFAGEIRFLQTQLCAKNELGQMFAYVALAQFVMGQLAISVFKELYAVTLFFWPAFYLALLGVISLTGMILVAIIDRLKAADDEDGDGEEDE
ncbi:proton-coupled folate transporter-like [Watersipora subatra]|uniref:proton-coupled folate transporter-like n=1 Tax=Watersipora subatra TaxID=2589382 RepID=UPI00355C7BDC